MPVMLNTMGWLLKQVLNFSHGLSTVSNTFEQNINLGYDLVLVLINNQLYAFCLFHSIMIPTCNMCYIL